MLPGWWIQVLHINHLCLSQYPSVGIFLDFLLINALKFARLLINALLFARLSDSREVLITSARQFPFQTAQVSLSYWHFLQLSPCLSQVLFCQSTLCSFSVITFSKFSLQKSWKTRADNGCMQLYSSAKKQWYTISCSGQFSCQQHLIVYASVQLIP